MTESQQQYDGPDPRTADDEWTPPEPDDETDDPFDYYAVEMGPSAMLVGPVEGGVDECIVFDPSLVAVDPDAVEEDDGR